MKRAGFELIAVHFSLEPITDDQSTKKSRELAKIIGAKEFIEVPNAEAQATIAKNCTHKYFYLLTRRIMWRIAEKIAHKENAKYLVTGENIGQVGSQTVENMMVTNQAVTIPIIRPILCADKDETVKKARKIGTYELSCGPEICCILGPKHPATKATLAQIEAEEEKIDVEMMVKAGVEAIKRENMTTETSRQKAILIAPGLKQRINAILKNA